MSFNKHQFYPCVEVQAVLIKYGSVFVWQACVHFEVENVTIRWLKYVLLMKYEFLYSKCECWHNFDI